MKRLAAYTGIAALLVAGYMAYDWVTGVGKIPSQAFQSMTFSDDFDRVVGDKDGVVCHQILLRHQGDKDKRVVSHRLILQDFRKMTLEEKKAAIITDTSKDMEDAGLACYKPDGSLFFSEAYAQKHNPGGGGCQSVSCAAHITNTGNCDLSGPDCVITVICCGPCPPGCA